jgi:hypothetical protein
MKGGVGSDMSVGSVCRTVPWQRGKALCRGRSVIHYLLSIDGGKTNGGKRQKNIS